MRPTRPFVAFAFDSTHSALDAEALLEDMGIDVVPIPAPPSVSAQCGIAMRVPQEQAPRASKYLERGGIEVRAMVEFEDV